MSDIVQRVSACKICAGKKVYFYCKKDSSHYHICKECGLIFQDPVPEAKDMVDYANNQYQYGEYRDYVEAKSLKYAHFRSRLKQFQDRFPKGRLLDVGCSCGYFLDIALENGFDAFGVEFSGEAIAAAQPTIRERITQGSVNTLESHQLGSFDLVTAFDIIEHTEDPIDFLRQARGMLRQGGGIVLSTPDTGHALRYILGSRWPMLQPMQHTILFSDKSLRITLMKAGFQDIQVTPAYKTVTIDYLFQQIQSNNPFIFRVYGVLKKLIPEQVRVAPRKINIGEILAIAFNPV